MIGEMNQKDKYIQKLEVQIQRLQKLKVQNRATIVWLEGEVKWLTEELEVNCGRSLAARTLPASSI